MGPLGAPDKLFTLPQTFKAAGYNVTGAGKVFHQGGPSGGSGGYGGGDQPYSWSEWYWFCDQHWNQVVQSPAQVGWPPGPGPKTTGVGCTQTAECTKCLTEKSGLGRQLSWASADCADNCYPDGLVGDRTVQVLKEQALHPDKPFFTAAGFKRPHLGYFAPKWAYDLYPVGNIGVLIPGNSPSELCPQANILLCALPLLSPAERKRCAREAPAAARRYAARCLGKQFSGGPHV